MSAFNPSYNGENLNEEVDTLSMKLMIQSMLRGCDIKARSLPMDAEFVQQCLYDAISLGPILHFLTSRLRQPKFSSARIRPTALTIYIEDVYGDRLDVMEHFCQRLIDKAEQKTVILDAFAKHLRKINDHFGNMQGNGILIGTIKEVDFSVYAQAIPSLTEAVNYFNDILSLYKEEMAGEDTNFISIMAQHHSTTKSQIFQQLSDQVFGYYPSGYGFKLVLGVDSTPPSISMLHSSPQETSTDMDIVDSANLDAHLRRDDEKDLERGTVSPNSIPASSPTQTIQGLAPSNSKDKDIEKTVQTTTDSLDHLYVDFEPNDPRNPLNFSKRKKWRITVGGCIFTIIASLSAGSYNMGFPSMTRDLNCTDFQATIGLAVYPLGFGLIPLVTASFSEEFGRMPLYLASMLGFCACLVGIGGSHNIQSIIGARLVLGAFGSTGATMVGGTIADIWRDSERGLPMALFSAAAIAGTGLGPVMDIVVHI
ncbi:hypothetical protein ONZ45_g1756 [Pleurotus djamor]|nr:hypothetical protein ONZ45_g1756 [Pleurotus djamor]